jgi:hypothetical protein
VSTFRFKGSVDRLMVCFDLFNRGAIFLVSANTGSILLFPTSSIKSFQLMQTSSTEDGSEYFERAACNLHLRNPPPAGSEMAKVCY